MTSLNIYSTILVSVVFICVSVLTYAGKVSPHVITTLVGFISGWLLKQGATTVAEVRAARATPLPVTPRDRPPMPTSPAPATTPPFEANESPTARTRRSEAVTQPMQAFQKPELEEEKK
jgi:hypothetical protein